MKGYLLISSAIFALTIGGHAHARNAAPSIAAGEVGALQDIVVTARKRSESIQQVPSAITAMNQEMLADLQIRSFQDIGKTAPNVLIQKQTGEPTAPQFNIRGISAGSSDFRLDSGVALYVDGIYLGRPSNSSFDMADLETIEILRGPQGTLFGRNATGGAVSFRTAAPSGEFGVIAEATLGNYNRGRGRFTLNTPEWNGFSARLTYVHDENDGWARNSGPIRTFHYAPPHGSKTAVKTFGANNTESVLFALRFNGLDNLTVDYKFDWTDWQGSLVAMQLLNAGPVFSAITGFDNQPALGGTNVVGIKRLKTLPLDGMGPASQRTWGHSLTATYAITDGVTLKYLAGLRGFTQRSSSELDGNILFDPSGNGNEFQALAASEFKRQKQWSQELQLLGQSDRLNWVGGLFYFHEKASRNSPVIFGESHAPGAEIPLINPDSYLANALQNLRNTSFAAYAHAEYKLTPELEVAGGLRYSWDSRTENDLIAAPRGDGSPRGKVTVKQDRIDYDASLRYAFSANSSVYAKYATGFVSGGVLNGNPFRPETVKSIEIGAKTEFFDRHVRINAAVFQARRKSLQVAGFDPTQGGNILLNAGSERDRGFEIETTIIPLSGLALTGNYGFTDVKISTNVRTYQPRHTAYLAANYEFQPFANGSTLSLRLDGQYIGRHYRMQCPIGSTQSPLTGCSNLAAADLALDRALVIPSTWQLGARITLAQIPLGGGKAAISVWGKNLTDSDKLEFLFPLLDTWVMGSFQTPRTYGLDLKVEF
ncbi:TonB-dependent receptor [Caenibius sp. WL]|uniref:TonB-dependent receptor n=1 Tax=Caenibius sp. WL TaxID=2872646 RepID=UPI001C997D55|nr:TonB-dependent receptor [Caenibius sp. WL]QZP09506.1 TonB-dependent receptor [Caenibius sp. WL]